MRLQSLSAFGAVTLIATVSQPALADEAADSSIRVSATVPALCSLSGSSVQVTVDDQVATSTFFESCNTNRGFQVMALHRPLTNGEAASVTYDGARVPLEAEGFSQVQFRQGARHGPVDVRIATERLSAPLAVSFAMTPV